MSYIKHLAETTFFTRHGALCTFSVFIKPFFNHYTFFSRNQIEELAKTSKFEAEIRAEQELKKRELEQKKLRRAEFLEKAALFSQQH